MNIRSVAAALVLGIGSASAADVPDCSTFTWDMTRELALFAGAATALSSGADAATSPKPEVGTLYEISIVQVAGEARERAKLAVTATPSAAATAH